MAGKAAVVLVAAVVDVFVDVVDVEVWVVAPTVVVVVSTGSPALEHAKRSRRTTGSLDRIRRKVPKPRFYARGVGGIGRFDSGRVRTRQTLSILQACHFRGQPLRFGNMSALILWIGVALESFGFFIAWRDLSLEEEAIERFIRGPATVRPNVFRATVLFPPGVISTEGPSPTTGQRIEALEAQFLQLRDELDTRLKKQTEEFKERLDHVHSSLGARLNEEIGALALVVQSVHRDTTRRRQGIVLFIVGAVLSGASQVIS